MRRWLGYRCPDCGGSRHCCEGGAAKEVDAQAQVVIILKTRLPSTRVPEPNTTPSTITTSPTLYCHDSPIINLESGSEVILWLRLSRGTMVHTCMLNKLVSTHHNLNAPFLTFQLSINLSLSFEESVIGSCMACLRPDHNLRFHS